MLRVRSLSRRAAAFLRTTVRYASSHAPIVLRPYQEACIESCLEAINAGHSRIGVSSPTGSGKTTVGLFHAGVARFAYTPKDVCISH